MEEVRACFTAWDTEGRGKIDRGLLDSLMQTLSQSVTPATMQALISKAGGHSDREVPYEPFLRVLCGEIADDLRAEAIFLALDSERKGTLDLQWLLKEEDIHFRAPAMRNACKVLERQVAEAQSVLDLVGWQALFRSPTLLASEACDTGSEGNSELSGLEDIAKLYISMRFRDLAVVIAHPYGNQSTLDYVDKEQLRRFLQAAQRRGLPVSMMLKVFDSTRLPDGKSLDFQGWRRFMDAVRADMDTQTMVQALLLCEDEINAQLSGRYEDTFAAIDVDCSGALDKTEILHYMTAAGLPHRSAAAAAQVLEHSCDTNKDGKVTLLEWKAMFAADRERKGAQGAIRTLCWFESIAADFLHRRIDKSYNKLCGFTAGPEGSLELAKLLSMIATALQAGDQPRGSPFGLSSAAPAATQAFEMLQEAVGTSDQIAGLQEWHLLLNSQAELYGRKKFAELVAGCDALCQWMELR
mmetsp:Transcript_19786/g.35889  ORF Transcript_19786/g.35889 Transcript_19786/m.35889 type:complete len:468 (+) Transcript_19786:57-1460(+)